jgi:hypothetical protein
MAAKKKVSGVVLEIKKSGGHVSAKLERKESLRDKLADVVRGK